MDSQYLKQQVGEALKFGLCEIVQKKPKDPIDYLSNWLLKYVDNVEYKKQVAIEREQLAKERAVAEEERSRREAMEEEQQRIAEEELIMQMETDAILNKADDNTAGVTVTETQDGQGEADEAAPEMKTEIHLDETNEEVGPDANIVKTEVITDIIEEESEPNEEEEVGDEVADSVTDSLEAS